MTDKQMDDLAIKVATKVVGAIFNVSSEVHLVFDNNKQATEYMINSESDLDYETLQLELIRLNSLLDRYISSEEYLKAEEIKKQIKQLKDKYDKRD